MTDSLISPVFPAQDVETPTETTAGPSADALFEGVMTSGLDDLICTDPAEDTYAYHILPYPELDVIDQASDGVLVPVQDASTTAGEVPVWVTYAHERHRISAEINLAKTRGVGYTVIDGLEFTGRHARALCALGYHAKAIPLAEGSRRYRLVIEYGRALPQLHD